MSLPKGARAEWPPAQIAAAVPATGSSAVTPGKGVAPVYRKTEARIAATPAPATTVPRRLLHSGLANASSAPAPNSHARVKVEKYASLGDCVMRKTLYANDATVATAIATKATRRHGKRRNAHIATTSMIGSST